MNVAGMNSYEIKGHLFSLTNKGIKYDLDRITDAAQRCGNPQLAYKCFHVAGTNGKGSTCVYLESMLRAGGLKTGLYTSPHLLDFEERFQIDGKIIGERQWLDIYKDVKDVIEDLNLTFFEASTLIAFELFKRNNVQWAVFEAGLGGRLDATNIVKPQVSVITGVALDHTDLLGKDLISIAREKAGIIKKNVPAVVAFNSDQQVNHLFNAVCASLDSPCFTVSLSDAGDIQEKGARIFFSRKEKRYTIRMGGRYQVLNALLALETMERAGLLDDVNCTSGLLQAFLPCRFQEMNLHGKKLVLDVGHNLEAAEVTVNNLARRFEKESICIVTGIMKDKDYSAMIRKYSEIADTVILSRPDVERASLPQDLMKSVPPGTVKAMMYDTMTEAISAAFGGPHEVICIAGSFFTVGEVCRLMGIDPYIFC